MDAQAAPVSSDAPGRWASAVLVAAFWVAAVATAAAAATFRSFELDRFFVPKELALHVGAFAMALVLAARRGERRFSRADLALTGWIVLSAASAVMATSGWHAMRALSISLSAAVVFVGASVLREAGRGRDVVLALAVAATLAVASSLAQAYGIEHEVFATNRAPGGLLGNRNFVAHVAAIGLPLLVYLAATARTSVGTVAGALAILAMSAALVLSRTRAAWLALAVWFVLVLPLAWQGRGVIRTALPPRRGMLLGGALAAGLALALLAPNTLDWRSDSPYLDSVRGVVNYREGSGAGRLKQYTNSLKIARAHPVLGVGPGNWAAEYPGYAARNDPSLSDATGMTANPWPSSDWVAAVAERGLPAALSLAALLLLLVWNAWRGWRDSVYSSAERLAALAGGSAVCIAIVEGSFDAVTLLAFPSVLVWGAAGALIPAGRPVATWRTGPRARVYLLLAAAIVWLVATGLSAGKLEAMRAYSKGTYDSVRAAATYDPGSYRIQMRAAELLSARGNCRLAVHHAKNAGELFPKAAAPREILARCGVSSN